MEQPANRPEDRAEQMAAAYGDMLFRFSLFLLKQVGEAEDVVQDTLVRYLQKTPVFESPEHEKAWLFRVAANLCRDRQRAWKRHPQLTLTELQSCGAPAEDSGILEALMTLSEKFRVVLLLYYVEEYPMEDIARIIGRSKSAVKMRLQKGRKLLEEVYRKEYC